MERTSFADQPCPIARSMDVLGDWWNPLILRECLYGIRRFDEIQRWLGIGRNILTRRLALLVEAGLLERRQYQERPARHEYHLTERGYDAALVLVSLMGYGDRWHFGRGERPIRLLDRRTGEPVEPVLVDRRTGEAIDVRNLLAAPGPGFPPVEQIQRERFADYFARVSAASPS